jgi:alkylhydroperoxidase/carboxymuconolactone decarboxylase family protein YurZ
MHTVVETPMFIRNADKAGVTDEEREHIITTLATTPDAGDVMSGTGGARKIRFAANTNSA